MRNAIAQVEGNVGTQVTPAPTTAPTTTTPVTPTSTAPTTPVDQAQIERDKISAQNKATLEQNKQQADLKQAEKDKVAMDDNNALANSETAILNTLRTG